MNNDLIGLLALLLYFIAIIVITAILFKKFWGE